jgi:hypothetical protein
MFISRKDYDKVVPLKGSDLEVWKKMKSKWSLAGVDVEPKTPKEKELVDRLFGKAKIAKALLKIAKDLLANDDMDELVRAIDRKDWKYYALFKGKRKPGNKPDSAGKIEQKPTNIGRIVVKLLDFKFESESLTFTYEGSAGRVDTYVFSMEPYDVMIPTAQAPKKKVGDIRGEIIKKLLNEHGLVSLGTRMGKAGDQFALKADSARRIAVGNREFLLNCFVAEIRHESDYKSPAGGWRMVDTVLLSKIDDRIIAKAVEWLKKGPTMVEVREDARKNWDDKKAKGDDSPFGYARG